MHIYTYSEYFKGLCNFVKVLFAKPEYLNLFISLLTVTDIFAKMSGIKNISSKKSTNNQQNLVYVITNLVKN